MSKALKKRGFTFVGSTICYAFMQATGMVNDHVRGCFRAKQVELIREIRRGVEQANRGELIEADTVFARLRQRQRRGKIS